MKKLKGFTVIEIMIGLAIGLIVVASAGSFIISTLRFNMDNVKQQRFEQVIQILKNTIASGLRRAGFSNSATSLPDVTGWTAGTIT
jgi:prepilin peptidase dependent protein B